MSLIRRNNLLPSMGLFDDFWTRDLMNWGLGNNSNTNTTIPAVNVKETADHFEVEMAAPGMKKEDFRIELNGNQLTISSERSEQNEEKNEDFYSKREFSYQSFQRTFQLPKDVVDSDNIAAHYENGVLKMLIPKKEEAKKKAPRQIQIS